MLGLAAINVGVIKYLLQFLSYKEKQKHVITTGIIIVSCASTGILFFLIFSKQKLCKTIFHSYQFGIFFKNMDYF